MANIYRGLNIEFNFADIVNNRETLSNLGLSIEDIDLINGKNTDDGQGLSAFGLTTTDLKMASGLTEDQRRSLYSIAISASETGQLISGLSGINSALENNITINDQIRAGAIKYNYYDYASGSVRSADISTSRVSSWSELDANKIFYGGEVEVIDGGSGSNVAVTSLGSTQDILEKPTFFTDPADEPVQPTHLITVNLNGTNRNVYAMKGIPLQFDTFFRNANSNNLYTGSTNLSGLYYQVQSGSGKPVWRIVNKTDAGVYDSSSLGLNATRASYTFFDNTSKSRTVEFYYNPDKIVQLGVPNLNINRIPNVAMSSLTYYNLTNNDLSEVPDFTGYSSLETVILSGNNLSRARNVIGAVVTANTQLNTLPNTVENLYINGCFSDNETIDVSTTLPNLKVLEFDSSYGTSQSRSMSDNGVSPIVPTGIVEYKVSRHNYTECANNVCQSTALEVFDIYANNIIAREGDNDLSLTSTNLKYFRSRSNSHNLVDVTGKSQLTYYEHADSRGLRNGASNDINNIFDNTNTALQDIILNNTDAYGAIDTAFANLPQLKRVDIRKTRNSGSLNDNSFSGSSLIERIFIQSGNYNSSDFFGADAGNGTVFSSLPNLFYIITVYNSNISGPLPVLSEMPKLRYVYIHNTGVTGNIPSIEGSGIRTLYLSNNSLSGNIPSFNNDSIFNIILFSNALTSMSPPSGANIRNISTQNNSLAGDIPTMEGSPNLNTLRLQNNGFTGYTTGAISTNRFIRTIDFSNNSIGSGSFNNIIEDLTANYLSNGRGGVTVNLSGNGFSTNDLSPENLDKYNFLISKWTIVI